VWYLSNRRGRTTKSRLFSIVVIVAALAAAGAPGAVTAQSLEARQAEKCAQYRQAYTFATARQGMGGIGKDFLEKHDAFLASGCTLPPDVCALSVEEVNLANLLIVLGMNQGMASTFFPFKCAKSR
jgi:hypothetical protein